MAHHTPSDLDPQQLEEARMMWAGFTNGAKWSIAAIVIVLVLMAFAFIG